MGERMLQLAEHLDDVDMKIEGQMVTGYNLAFTTRSTIRPGASRKRDRSHTISQRQRAGRLGIGPYPGVVSLNVSALFLWMRGYPDRAHNRAAEAIALARKLNHPYSITYALFHNGLLNMWLKNYEIARDSARSRSGTRRGARVPDLERNWLLPAAVRHW